MENLTAQLREIDNKIPNINAGGCGIFALELGKKLKQNNIKFKYVLISYNKEETFLSSTRNFNRLPEDIKTNMEVLDRHNYGVSHVMIYHKGCFIDSTGVYNKINETRWGGGMFNPSSIINEDYLSMWCKDGCWNNTFNRDNIPTIKEMINNLTLN